MTDADPPWDGDENEQADGSAVETKTYRWKRCGFTCEVTYHMDTHDYSVVVDGPKNKWASRALSKLEGIRKANGYAVAVYAENFRKFT